MSRAVQIQAVITLNVEDDEHSEDAAFEFQHSVVGFTFSTEHGEAEVTEVMVKSVRL